MNKADKIIKKHKKELKHYKNSIYAGVCPTCQEKLQLKTIQRERIVTKYNIFRKDTQSTVIKNDVIVICPNNHQIIHPKYGEQSNPGCTEYGNTLNKEIRNYHNSHYGWDDDGGC